MNGISLICVILLLSAMTVSTVTFATNSVKVVADSVAMYCYTAEEARQIAVLLAKGEQCDSLLILANRQVELLDSVRIKHANLERNLSAIQQQADTLVSELAERNKVLQRETEKLRKKERCKNRLIGGSVVLNVLLIVLLAI
jgi:peptidoglycan hydrolase CwlO-like protein